MIGVLVLITVALVTIDVNVMTGITTMEVAVYNVKNVWIPVKYAHFKVIN